ncbi:MAG: hypothetical protein FI680_02010 [SAR202 cluster bacterium]|nr:hypothetical protein [SAR202 cluster bacterium]
MRMLLRAIIPTDAGNARFKDGSMKEALDSVLGDMNPEAVYFYLENGRRACIMIFEMNDVSQLPAAVEPWFLSMGADVTLVPVMNGEDFEKAGPSLGATIQKYQKYM